MTLRDESGWLGDDDPCRNGLADLLDRAGFDGVEFLDRRDLQLVRDLPRS